MAKCLEELLSSAVAWKQEWNGIWQIEATSGALAVFSTFLGLQW